MAINNFEFSQPLVSGSDWNFVVDITYYQDVEANTTTFTFVYYLETQALNGQITFAQDATYAVNFDGTNYTGTCSISKVMNIGDAGRYKLGTVTTTGMKHGPAGEIATAYLTFALPNISIISTGETITPDEMSDGFEIPGMQRASTITAAATYIGEKTVIYIKEYLSNPSHTLSYSIGTQTGGIDVPTDATSVEWTVPTSILSEIPLESSIGIVTLTCTTYDSAGDLVGSEGYSLRVIRTANQFAPKVTDINIYESDTTNISLTGSKYVFIRGFNSPKIEFTAKYRPSDDGLANTDEDDFANNIVSVLITNGTNQQRFTNNSAYTQAPYSGINYYRMTYSNITASDFTIKVVDGQSLSGFGFHEVEMVDYSPVVVMANSTPVTVEGVWNVEYFGTWFNNTFGAVNNTLQVIYRWRVANAYSWSGWISNTPTKSGSNFNGTISISGLDYESKEYEIEISVTDKLTSDTALAIGSGKPIFDWSDQDFHFNVPTKHSQYVAMANGQGIYGTDTGGELVEALAYKSDNSLYLGYGGYQNETGTTYICGNDIQFLSNSSSGVNIGGVNLTGLANAMSNSYELQTYVGSTDTSGMNHAGMPGNFASAYACLRGNNLYVRFHSDWGTLADATATPGDIEDQFLGCVAIYHDGKITEMDYMTAVSGSSGTTCGLQMKNIIYADGHIGFDVYLCNAAATTSTILTTFNIPVTLNLDAFV